MANRRTPRRGSPLKTTTALTATASGRAVNWRAPIIDHQAFHETAEDRGMTASELAREIVECATRATPPNATGRDEEYVYLSARFSHDQIDRLSYAAAAIELEPTVLLRLLTTRAGDVLLAQLQQAVRVRRGR